MPSSAAKRPKSDLKLEYDRLQAKIARLEQKKKDLLEAGDSAKCRLSFVQDNDQDIQLYTGFSNHTALTTFYDFLEAGPEGANLKWHCSEDVEGRISTLSLENELLLTMMKVRLGLTHDDLAFRFGLKRKIVNNIVESWFGLIYERFSAIKLWMSRREVDETMPESFKKNYYKTRVIFREIELKTVQSSDWNFSDLNSIITLKKSILGFSPSGKVTFISPILDAKSKGFELTEKFTFQNGDSYMSTCGFNFQKVLHENNPEFLRSNSDSVPSSESGLADDVFGILNNIDEFRILDRPLPEEDAEMILKICCHLLNCQIGAK